MNSHTSIHIIQGDAATELDLLCQESVQCCVTSPPYYLLRDYGVRGQIGLEPSITDYLERLVNAFRSVRKVLKPDGVLWLNMGDTYTCGKSQRRCGLKPKNLMGVPWRLALALQRDGWYLRRDVIWHKPNAMPEAVLDRPCTDHEYLFMLTKSYRYYYDSDKTLEPVSGTAHPRGAGVNPKSKQPGRHSRVWVDRDPSHSPARKSRQNESYASAVCGLVTMRRKRSVWSVATRPFRGAHFATFPPKLVEPCILTSSRPGDTILDPFAGTGTVGEVAARIGRKSTLIELNPDYVAIMKSRLAL